jgi:hypothetical protein
MSVSGIAITLGEAPEAQDAALAALARDPSLTLGPRAGTRLAAVLETPSAAADRAAFARLEALPGVVHVGLVCSYLDPETSDPPEESP